MFEAWQGKLRYLLGLREFLAHTLTPEEAREVVVQGIARREQSFLRLLELGVYPNPKSPFRKLLEHAGIDLARVASLIQEMGLEQALKRLYDEGVYVTYEELRGKTPVKRGNLEFTIDYADLDNPLLATQYEMRSSGARSAGSRSFMDLALLAHESAYYALLLDAHGLRGRPIAIWRPVPPSSTGINNSLRYTKLGSPPLRWFSQQALPEGFAGLKTRLLLQYTRLVALLARKRLQLPRYVPQEETVIIARWLAGMTARGTPAVFDTSASGATRICLEARRNNLDISGTVFEVGSEPYTPAKAAVVAAANARAIDRYSASEFGTTALGCAASEHIDDMHLVTDKVLVTSHEKVVDESGAKVPALVFTTLLGNCPKILVNAESGDYGHLEERDCGCLLGTIGFKTHVVGVHGYDKLTSEGVTFMGTELYRLVEEVLPARFGGDPIDYQIVEQEDEHGLPKVHVVVAPSVGSIDEEAVLTTVLDALKGYDRYDRGAFMANQWRQGETLRVVRREPHQAGSRKILPLHILQRAESSAPVATDPGKS